MTDGVILNDGFVRCFRCEFGTWDLMEAYAHIQHKHNVVGPRLRDVLFV